jgi:hypothetical protein
VLKVQVGALEAVLAADQASVTRINTEDSLPAVIRFPVAAG